ncbi:hypothetical protein BDB00DRAFT_511514 [Zychaea mexicana]|uniref:uncharacterized protein n=1 Tax=Zychaea mexicana TaxID=64656 RepID=UPI0022FEFC4A|nr:uncharacterized protein BDB00DRAFT_511514 [Zychaea mexicana]KAI9491199.1 hypothetical protein BDB00DRAFT_511514 [Zychaea mexicana]
MEEQNHTLMDRNQQIEEEYRKVLAFKTLMDSYKEQVANLETANKTLIRDKNKMEYELQHITKKVEILEADRARDMDRIQVLEENLQEVQLGGTVDPVMSRHEVGDDTDDMDLDEGGFNDSLEESLKESNVTELKLSKRRLERQIKTLQEENASGRDQRELVLKHLLEDANRLKNQFEKNYLDVSQERDILQSDMARIRENVPDALVDQSQHTLSLRLHIVDLEKESKNLREENSKLEAKIAEGKFAFGDNAEEFRQMSERTHQLEEQTKKQLQQINKLLLEKDHLQGQSIEQKDLLLEKERLNSEMKASLAAFEAKDDEPIKQENARLQQQAIHYQEQIRELKIKNKKAKDFIMQQDKIIKDGKGSGSGDGNYGEAVASLQAELRLRDEENEKLRKQLHEVRLQTRREQQLIISAWYDVARRTHKELVNSKVAPRSNSWLGQQRRVLESQLRRR